MSRSDPVRSKFYEPLERAEFASGLLFYLGAVLSIVVLFVDKAAYPGLYNAVMIPFAVSVAALFGTELATRLYFGPRATDQRTLDFMSSVYNIKLTHELTDGYYNNELKEPAERLAAQLLENTHFTKAIAREMAKGERFRSVAYILIWLMCLLTRQARLDIVLAASQAIFSEQIISRCVRLEWLRARSERIYNDVYALFQSGPVGNTFNARALEAFVVYESVKANAAVTLSGRIFKKRNDELSAEWNKIQAALGIDRKA